MACGDYRECESCRHAYGDQEICDFCEEGDQYKQDDGWLEGAKNKDGTAVKRKTIQIKEIA